MTPMMTGMVQDEFVLALGSGVDVWDVAREMGVLGVVASEMFG